MEKKLKRTAIYARVSTQEQTVDSQLTALRQYAEQRNLEIIHTFIDKGISGKTDQRPGLVQLMDHARKHKIDTILVFRFDRFGRSTKHLVTALEEFQSLGIDFISYSENIDTGTPVGRVLFAIISAFAAFEREILAERVRAGLIAAKKRGQKLGRPTISEHLREKIRELKGQGLSIRAIAKILGVSKSAVQSVHKTP